MKLTKVILASVLAFACLSVAQAATTLKITGSTAFRKALYASIVNQLGSGSVHMLYIGSSPGGANQATFVSADGNTIVQCCMAGSAGGVNWVANGLNVATSVGGNTAQAWISTASSGGYATWSAATTNGTTFAVSGGTATTTGTATFEAASKADVTMSDSYQDSSPYTAAITGVTLTDSQGGVGVVTFTWAKGQQHPDISAAAYNRLTGMTNLAFQNLAANGTAPLSMFTGVAADATIDVVLVGRDNDSGTRLGTFAETGYGNIDTAAEQHFVWDGAAGTGNNIGSTGSGTIASITLAGGSSYQLAGYASGGNVKNALLAPIASGVHDENGLPFILVGYLGTGDTPGTALELAHNGVSRIVSGSASNLPYEYGQDTFWTLEHMYYKPTLATAQSTLADSIATNMLNVTAPISGDLIGNMHVTRGVEGGVVNPM